MRRARRRDDSTVKLELTGCTVTVEIKGNLFLLLPDERRLVSELTAVLQAYTDSENAAPKVKEIQ